MTMASEILCVNSQKGNKLCGGNKVHDQIDHVECQSSFSSLYVCHKKMAPEGINGTSNSEGCNSKPTKPDIVSEIATDNAVSTLSGAVNSDGNTFLHDKNGRIEASLEEPQQYSRQQTGCTLQDLYMQDHYDDEEDDDSDWEPANVLVIKRWFCTNCTMPNYDDNYHCEGCGERKDSKISPHDNSLAQASNDSDAVPRYQDSSSKICTSIGFDERMLLHSEVERKSLPHPERPDRLRAIASKLATAGLIPGKCSLIPAREITQEELQMVHSMDHIEAVQQTSCSHSSYFTPDTYANEHSACAARIAAGLCSDLAFSIMSGRSRNGFALVRPPGHHAGVKQAMGFCLHNNAAIAALAAQRAGAKKVLILDWDVHHGNGTQEIFDGNKSVLYVSLHRHEDGRFYPGTGAADEVGIMDAKGYSVNIPWSCGGVGDNDYIFAFQHIVLPIASDFAPDITIISAGFDAARGDPLGCCDVTPAGFAQMTHMLTALSQGKLLVVLEGGYNLRSISSSAVAVVKVLLGEDPKFEMNNLIPSRAGLRTALQVMKIQSKFWPVLKPGYLVLRSQWESFSSNKRTNHHVPTIDVLGGSTPSGFMLKVSSPFPSKGWLRVTPGDHVKKRKRLAGPFWWKLGSKRLMHELVYGGLHYSRGRRHAKRVC